MSQRRPARGGGGKGGPGGPANNAGARGALLLAVAVVLGIVLLQQFDGGIDTGGQVATGGGADSEETTTTVARLTTVPQGTSTTVATRPKADVKVLVANGAGVRGLAAATANALQNLGYTTLTPTDAPPTETTAVQFTEGYEAEAREVAASLTLPGTAVARLSAPPPVPTVGEANVVVVLGADVGATSTTSTTAGGGATSTTRR